MQVENIISVTLSSSENMFTSKLSTNYINFKQDSDLQMKTEESTLPTKLYLSLCIPPQTNDTYTEILLLCLLNPPILS